MGFDFVEGGYPLSNEKDAQFFQRVQQLKLKHARICAFGMTRRKGVQPEQDPGMKALLDSGAKTLTIVGKTSAFHVTEVLRVSLEENLAMIRDTVKYLRECGREVIYDAEHFFDGWKLDPEYAAKTVRAAAEAGACLVVLCDTNGGTMPEEIAALTKAAQAALPRAGRNSLPQRLRSGRGQFAGRRRCRRGPSARHDQRRRRTLRQCRFDFRLREPGRQKIGLRSADRRRRAAAHRAFALCLRPGQHELPLATSRSSAKAHSRTKAACTSTPSRGSPTVTNTSRPNRSATNGEFWSANCPAARTSRPSRRKHNLQDDRRELMDRKCSPKSSGWKIKAINSKPPKPRSICWSAALAGTFSLISKRSNTMSPSNATEKQISWSNSPDVTSSATPHWLSRAVHTEATVKLRVGDQLRHEVAEGDGPVNALDAALRKALNGSFPNLRDMHLVDYKVRVINSEAGTAAGVRVTIESRDENDVWGTVGVSENIIEASWKALVDAIEYKLSKDEQSVAVA